MSHEPDDPTGAAVGGGEPSVALAVIILAVGPDRVADRALQALEVGRSNTEIVVVSGRPIEARAVDRIAENTRASIRHVAVASGASAGAIRNVGVRASRARAFVIADGAERLTAQFLDEACALLSEQPTASFVVGPAHAPFHAREAPASPTSLSIADLVAGPWLYGRTAVIRRAMADACGLFDESLPALVDWDLRISLAESGHSGVVLPAGPAPMAPDDDVRLREALRTDRYLPSVRAIFLEHRESFERHPGLVLDARERLNTRLWTHERTVETRRNARQADLRAALDDWRAMASALAGHGRAPLEWTDLRRVTPVSRNWGLDRGRPIDRHYIESFLAAHAGDIRGTVLEMLDAGLTTSLGGSRVTRSDVLDIDPGNARATAIGDLRAADHLPSDEYDCFILTQTLHLIDDMEAALRQAHRVLKPGGVLLATVPAASMVAVEYGERGDHWRLTAAGARWLFERVFGPGQVEVTARGNVLATTAFLYGLCCDEVERHELDQDDPAYPLVITVRAVKRAGAPAVREARGDCAGGVLIYHRVAAPGHDRHRMAITPERLREQVAYLRECWHVMPLDELAGAARDGEAPPGAVALTFDDGYLDNLEVALPILAELEAPATFFLTTESLDRPRAYWWDVLERARLAGHATPALSLVVDGEARHFDTGSDAARLSAYDELYPIFQTSPPAVRDDLVRQIASITGAGANVELGRPLLRAEIVRLAASPLVTIGAHTVHHPALPAVDPDRLHREIIECRATLERLTGQVVDRFAYPFGLWSSEVVRALQSADIRLAVTCEDRPVRRSDRPLLLPRLAPPLTADAAELGHWLASRLGATPARPHGAAASRRTARPPAAGPRP